MAQCRFCMCPQHSEQRQVTVAYSIVLPAQHRHPGPVGRVCRQGPSGPGHVRSTGTPPVHEATVWNESPSALGHPLLSLSWGWGELEPQPVRADVIKGCGRRLSSRGYDQPLSSSGLCRPSWPPWGGCGKAGAGGDAVETRIEFPNQSFMNFSFWGCHSRSRIPLAVTPALKASGHPAFCLEGHPSTPHPEECSFGGRDVCIFKKHRWMLIT